MSYLALARKWRPRRFEEVVGQEHVVRALVHALDSGRLHHAYLFTGTRGVGKTTLARILAKALNCEEGVSAAPCGRCTSCREVDAGRFVDLIEVDAASRTKVEDTRELLDNVQYAPSRGRYKVYLVDEVHMLSAHSFNALLKTLEEPPEHVKFLLATTDPQKLPVTVLSRCLQLHLKRLPRERIAAQLGRILREEGIEHEEAALVRLARAAEGSMRDALSLLDQAIVHGAGAVRDADVRAMLGEAEGGRLKAILEALAEGDGARLLAVAREVADEVADCETVLADLVGLLQEVALAQVVPESAEGALHDPETVRELAARFSPEAVQLHYQIALTARADLALAPDPRTAFEMTLVRMLVFRPEGLATRVPPGGTADQGGPRPPRVEPVGAQAPSAKPAAPLQVAAGAGGGGDWGALVEASGVRGMARELALNCVLEARDDRRIRLRLDPARAQLRSATVEGRLRAALARHLGREDLRLEIVVAEPEAETPAQRRVREARERQAAAEAAIREDPVVQGLQAVLDARIEHGSVRPRDGGTDARGGE
ncbi:DNA polymerase III subunit gamma/tau [Inmirania thermothiophila]|uniref:DNA polymerase III subunit gamma/tau n=1 Tax=Inmirania thermothiophila TaxID=1750597 RepID=A0A3N1XZL0_9GAMM|nr:DNA polymerase III subunit gamma/tau [Inmirania thermothiophila]ROR32009.1 DNA polymerase-3 subunit gamma/tau [Inmirania thermothiophila]